MTLRVLVVDDDFMVASIHQRFVDRTEGFVTVATARSGADALAEAERTRPDLVLLDVHLPDIDGLEVLRRLRAGGHDVGVVMVTAERGADTVRAALLGGAMQYIVKPFDYEDLAGRLHAVAASLAHLDEGDADQEQIDRLFAATAPNATAPLPKGLSAETARLVRGSLREHGELSATEAGEAVGISRVSARRYLEHLATTGEAEVRLQYGAAGRPERRYRVKR